jgi:hypothetical protein
MAPSMGSAAQMALDTTSSFSSSSKWIEFISESITAQRSFPQSSGIRGTRSYDQSRLRNAPYKVGGTVTTLCDINSLDVWLKYILGSGPSSSVYSLAETLPSFYLMIDRVAKVFTYGPGYVNKATFTASPQDPQLKLSMELEFETESVGNSGTFPTGMTTDTNRPFIYSDVVITFASSTYSAFGWELTIDNNLLADRFVNEVTRSQIPATDRHVTAKLTTPWTSTEAGALYTLVASGGGSATAVFSNAEETISSTQSVLTFTTPYLIWPAKSPNVGSKASEIHLELNAAAYKTGSSAELSITNAHG